MEKKEFFCPTCKKFVKDVYSSGIQGTFAASYHPALVCRECDTAVMELTKTDKKSKKL